MADWPGVLGASYNALKILPLLAVYVVLLSVKTFAAAVGRRLGRIPSAGSRLAAWSKSRPETSSRHG